MQILFWSEYYLICKYLTRRQWYGGADAIWLVYFCCGKYLPGRLSGFGFWSIFTVIIEHGVLVNIYFGQYLSRGNGMAVNIYWDY